MINKRIGLAERVSSETKSYAEFCLSRSESGKIKTKVGFFDHMIDLLAVHGDFTITLDCDGDLEVDGHHTVEDAGIVLGKAFSNAVGDKKGINRYGTFFVPMDESLAMVSLDISGRPFLCYQVPTLTQKIGDFDTQLVEEFFRAFSLHAGITLHISVLYGKNSHHMIEAVFKAFGRALRQAVAIGGNTDAIPSSKGIID